MQISFDALNPLHVKSVRAFLDHLEGKTADAEGVDTRDPAAVFAQSAAPLPPAAPSIAVAGPLPTAPAASPVSLPLPTVAGQLPVWPAPGSAVPSAPADMTSPASGEGLDVTGLPWDARIHAGTKRKNADGSWTAKKGINDPSLVQRVIAELRSVMHLPAPAPVAPAPAQAALPLPALPTLPAALPVPTPAPLAATPPAAAAAPANFDELMPRITAAVAAGVLPEGALLAAVQAHQLPSLVALTARPDFVGPIWTYLQAQYPALV